MHRAESSHSMLSGTCSLRMSSLLSIHRFQRRGGGCSGAGKYGSCRIVRDKKSMSNDDGQSATCPVDHSSLEWKNLPLPADHPPVASSSTSLPQHREVSSIPRTDGTNWVYPSQAQFYAAMARKQHDPRASDMRVLVPIHNSVNERAWSEVMTWERGNGGEKCGGIKLTSFKGRPMDRSPRARLNILLGSAQF